MFKSKECFSSNVLLKRTINLKYVYNTYVRVCKSLFSKSLNNVFPSRYRMSI